jgi:hypothetical protein
MELVMGALHSVGPVAGISRTILIAACRRYTGLTIRGTDHPPNAKSGSASGCPVSAARATAAAHAQMLRHLGVTLDRLSDVERESLD